MSNFIFMAILGQPPSLHYASACAYMYISGDWKLGYCGNVDIGRQLQSRSHERGRRDHCQWAHDYHEWQLWECAITHHQWDSNLDTEPDNKCWYGRDHDKRGHHREL